MTAMTFARRNNNVHMNSGNYAQRSICVMKHLCHIDCVSHCIVVVVDGLMIMEQVLLTG